MVTLKDVAKKCGLAVSTASNALSGTGRISPATRRLVREAAAELGYSPNPAAQIMSRTQRARGSGKSAIAIAYLSNSKSLEGAQQALSGPGLILQQHSLVEVQDTAALFRRFQNTGIDGIILDSKAIYPDQLKASLPTAPWERYAVLKLGNGLPQLKFNSLRHSVFMQTQHALDRMLQAGFRRIVFAYQESSSFSDDRARLGAAMSIRSTLNEDAARLELWPLNVPKELKRLSVRVKDPVLWESWYLKTVPLLRQSLLDLQADAVLGFSAGLVHALLKDAVPNPAQRPAYVGLAHPIALEPDISGPLGYDEATVQVAIDLIKQQLSLGLRGLPAKPFDHVLPVQWHDGTSCPPLPPPFIE